MIERNVGPVERVLRLLLAIMLMGWIISGSVFGVSQGLALLAAMALLWNSIFARCYLWKWIGITSCSPCNDESCKESGA